MKIFALCLMMFAVALFTAPASFAYTPDPLFGVNWRPDVCVDGSPGIQMCVNLYTYVSEQSNFAIDWAVGGWTGGYLDGCLSTECLVSRYQSYMDGIQPQACYYTFGTGSSEMMSWCVELFNIIERDTIAILDPSGAGCTGACFKGDPRLALKKADFWFRRK